MFHKNDANSTLSFICGLGAGWT